MFRNIILFYIFMVLGFWGFYKVSTEYFNPTVITKRDTVMTKFVSHIKVKDFIEHERTFYILSEDNKVHVFDIYSGKFINVFTVEGIGNIEKITVHNYLKVGVNQERKFYIAFLSKEKVYLSKLKNNTATAILKPTLIFDDLQYPIDIYMYNEYYKILPEKYQDNLVILVKENNKTILNVYNLETKELLERLDAKINITSIGSRSFNQDIHPKNIINFNRINVSYNQTKRVFFDTLKIGPNNRYTLNLETITHSRYGSYYILPDSKNNALWIYDVLWLSKNNKVNLNQSPEKAYVLLFDSHQGRAIFENNLRVKFLIKYKNSNTLEVIKTEDSQLKKMTDFSRKMFELLVMPFISLSYVLALLFGSIIYQ